MTERASIQTDVEIYAKRVSINHIIEWIRPWQTDEECAQEAYNHFQVEIRCSVNGWTSESEDSGGWYRFTDSGKTVVNWLT